MQRGASGLLEGQSGVSRALFHPDIASGSNFETSSLTSDLVLNPALQRALLASLIGAGTICSNPDLIVYKHRQFLKALIISSLHQSFLGLTSIGGNTGLMNLSRILQLREADSCSHAYRRELRTSLEDGFVSNLKSRGQDTNVGITEISADGMGVYEYPIPENSGTTISMAISHDDSYLATTHGDHTVKVYDLRSGQLIREFRGHPRTPWTVKFHPQDSNILCSGCIGGEARVWCINVDSSSLGSKGMRELVHLNSRGGQQVSLSLRLKCFFLSMMLVSCVMWSGALDSSGFLL